MGDNQGQNGYLKHQHHIPFWQIALMGVFLTTFAWSIIILGGSSWFSGRVTHSENLFYNIPITFIFATLAVELFLSLMPFGWDTLRPQIPFVVVWIVGFIQLYLRLIEQSIPVSGHLTWLPLMLTQTVLRHLPKWFLALGILTLIHAAWYNFFLFPSPVTGLNGLLLGTVMAFILGLWIRIEKLPH